MKVFCWPSPAGNIGDDLNTVIWPRLFPRISDVAHNTIFLGIGSVLDNRHGETARKIVFGAGARSETTVPDVSRPEWDVRFVRGPLTARALGLGDESWITDPAILALSVFSDVSRCSSVRGNNIGFIPYYKTNRLYSSKIARLTGLMELSVSMQPINFIETMLTCKIVIAESMHGAILADTFGIPWIPCRISNISNEDDVHHFKWNDWMSSMSVASDFVTIPNVEFSSGDPWSRQARLTALAFAASWTLRRAMKRNVAILSERFVLKQRHERLIAEVERLRKDYDLGAAA